MDLKDRRVLITGASSGIGEVTAKQFASAGAEVIILSEHDEGLKIVSDAIIALGGRAICVTVDLSHRKSVDGLFDCLERQYGPIDILVNNAGIGLGASVLETKDKDLRFLFEVNLFSLISLSTHALAAMSARKSGHIINVSSGAARMGLPGVSAYSATKGAVHTFTQSLRIEARAFGVHVTEVLPISVRTMFFEHLKGKKYRPGGLVISKEKVARSIVHCALHPRRRAEVLPFSPLHFAYIMEVVAPGLFSRITGRSYSERLEAEDKRGEP